MRRLTILAGAAAAALALCLGLATPAAAGGPTSVILVNPGSGQADALHVGLKGYGALVTALGDGNDGGRVLGRQRGRDRLGGAGGRQITLTWLVHDVQPWRVDHLFPDADGGPVVLRKTSGSRSESWQRVAQPERLMELLTGLGVMGRNANGGGPQYVPVEPAWGGSAQYEEPATEDVRYPVAAEEPESGSSAATGWWWTLPGAAAGALLAAALPYGVRRWRARTTVANPGPQRELLDLDT